MKTITQTHLLVLLALLLKGCINPFGEWRSKGDYVKMTLEVPVPDLVHHLVSKTKHTLCDFQLFNYSYTIESKSMKKKLLILKQNKNT